MDIKNKKILEALQMQPLSEEEMTARHILGRLYGPIATCIESTRNGRLYNKPLWEKALEDEIFLEKVATKALFLELGHPADREETDMKQQMGQAPGRGREGIVITPAMTDRLAQGCIRLLLTAAAFGFRTRDINLSLLGGCASLISLPRKAWQEFLTALAGPLVSFALAAIGFFTLFFFDVLCNDIKKFILIHT